MTSFTNAIKEGSIDIVPRTLINAGTEGEGKGANAFESLVMLLLSEKLTAIGESKSIDESEDILKIKEEIINNLREKKPTELEIN